MYRLLSLSAAALVLAVGSAAAQGQQKLELSLDPNGSPTVAPAPKCSSVSGNYALLDDNGEQFGTISGSQTKGTWHLGGTVEGTAIEYRSNWVCDDEFTTVYSKANPGAEGPEKIFVIKYEDGSVGIEYDEADGTEAFLGYLESR